MPRYVKRCADRKGPIWVGGALLDQDVRHAGRTAPVFLAACAVSVADHSSGSGPAGSHVPHGTAARTGLTARLYPAWLPVPGQRDEGKEMRDEAEIGPSSSLVPRPSSLLACPSVRLLRAARYPTTSFISSSGSLVSDYWS